MASTIDNRGQFPILRLRRAERQDVAAREGLRGPAAHLR